MVRKLFGTLHGSLGREEFRVTAKQLQLMGTILFPFKSNVKKIMYECK